MPPKTKKKSSKSNKDKFDDFCNEPCGDFSSKRGQEKILQDTKFLLDYPLTVQNPTSTSLTTQPTPLILDSVNSYSEAEYIGDLSKNATFNELQSGPSLDHVLKAVQEMHSQLFTEIRQLNINLQAVKEENSLLKNANIVQEQKIELLQISNNRLQNQMDQIERNYKQKDFIVSGSSLKIPDNANFPTVLEAVKKSLNKCLGFNLDCESIDGCRIISARGKPISVLVSPVKIDIKNVLISTYIEKRKNINRGSLCS